MNESATENAPVVASPETAAPAPRPGRRLPRWVLPGIVILAAGVAAWQIVDLRLRVEATQSDQTRLAAENAALVAEVRATLRRGQETLAALQEKTAVLDARSVDAQARQTSLEGAYQDLARGREEWLLNEVEQLVGLASQQLQLAGNVQAALQALSTADARLARVQRPHLIALRKAIAQDLQRLRALPGVDLAGMALRIENIAVAVEAMGLAYDARPGVAVRTTAGKSPEPGATDPWWQRGLREVWAEFRTLVRIERMDRPEPVVLAPNQAFFLRENLKLRLLSARVELLSRDQAAFRGEVRLALQWLEKHFDPKDRKVQAAIEVLRPFLAAEFSIEAPTLAASQAALRAVKFPAERAPR